MARGDQTWVVERVRAGTPVERMVTGTTWTGTSSRSGLVRVAAGLGSRVGRRDPTGCDLGCHGGGIGAGKESHESRLGGSCHAGRARAGLSRLWIVTRAGAARDGLSLGMTVAGRD